MNYHSLYEYLNKYFDNLRKKDKKHANIECIIESEKLGLKYSYDNAEDKPFHIASIGKMFTSILIMRLEERNILSTNATIIKYLNNDILKDLFIINNVDHKDQITIKQLLTHTSGIADYFDDKTEKWNIFIRDVVDNPNVFWTPQSILDFTNSKLKMHNKPGIFHYSDTGYLLLGLIIEKITNKPLYQNFHDEFFNPLGMNDSYMLFYSTPKNNLKGIDKIWIFNKDISKNTSLSAYWGGGGIISTTRDLIIFLKALHSGKLIKLSNLEQMQICNMKFVPGIMYGTGVMELCFDKMPFLKKIPRLKGHVGVFSSYLFYDKTKDLYICLNLGKIVRILKGFKIMLLIEKKLNNILKI